jgi:ATP-dependent RNA helicase DeaD
MRAIHRIHAQAGLPQHFLHRHIGLFRVTARSDMTGDNVPLQKTGPFVIETLSAALAEQGYTSLTPVQEAMSDAALFDKDLLVSAQTGSGKTVGFGLAIAPTLLPESVTFGSAEAPLGLVIAPTRELALQVARELSWLYSKAGGQITTCVGGMDSRSEARALQRGTHLVVATPGRLCDHIKRGNIDLSRVRAVVLDEADEMLDMGFREELEFILDEAPSDRRTLLFSATVPKAIARLAESYQRDAQRISLAGETRQHADITYRALTTHPRDVEHAIINVLRFYEACNAIVFCNTRAAVTRLTTRLTNRGFSVVALSGELTQSERSNALQALRDGRARVCVATDVAARGIDLPNLDLVIHADLPGNADTLLHRSGRTGRAGRKGVSALIVPASQRSKAHRLLGWAKLEADWSEPPSVEEVIAEDRKRLLSDPLWSEALDVEAQELAETLLARFSPEQLARGFVTLYRAQRSAPEELADPSEPVAKPARVFGPSVWFALSQGRKDGADPRRVLPMLCRKGGLDRADVGAIRIETDRSLVEIAEQKAGILEQALAQDGTIEPGMTVTRLTGAPASTHTKSPRKAQSKAAPRPEAKRDRRAAKPDPKPAAEAQEYTAKPARKKTKPVWTAGSQDRAKAPKREDAPKTKRAKQASPKRPKASDAHKKRAADPSKRFVPPKNRGTSPARPKPRGKGEGRR